MLLSLVKVSNKGEQKFHLNVPLGSDVFVNVTGVFKQTVSGAVNNACE